MSLILGWGLGKSRKICYVYNEMRIKYTEHAIERMRSRGASKSEVEKTILYGSEIPAKVGRKAKEMVFNYGKSWLGMVYPEKKVVAIYVEEGNEIVVITVKVFYGKWR